MWDLVFSVVYELYSLNNIPAHFTWMIEINFIYAIKFGSNLINIFYAIKLGTSVINGVHILGTNMTNFFYLSETDL